MATVQLWGAIYVDVPAVTLPSENNTTVTFYEAIDGDSLSYGTPPRAGTAQVGMSALCEESES